MRIAIDAMGGDAAPASQVEGALRALTDYSDVEIVLVGDRALIDAELARHDSAEVARISIRDAQPISSGEDPVRAVRATTDNSPRVCAELLRHREVAGVVTMGSTGAAVAAATLWCRRLEGVKRLGIAVPFPRPNGLTIVIDGGANPEAKPVHMHQYAIMASHYVKYALGVENPRVGILSIGEEEHKGNRLVAEIWEAFRANPVEGFVGNVEPRECFEDRADVVVTDGFTGNIALKAAEGMGELIIGTLKSELADHPEIASKILKAIASRADYSEYGGAPLLGLDGGYIIGHGRSGPHAFRSGVRAIHKFIVNNVGDRIVEALSPASSATEGA